MTTTEENKEIVRREFEAVWTERDLDVVDEIYADEVSVGTVRTGSEKALVDTGDLKALVREWLEAFPDAAMEINEIVAEDDSVMTLWTMRGTHEGPFRGIEATGNEVTVDGYGFRRLRDGKIVETKSGAGFAGLLEQLGVELPLEA